MKILKVLQSQGFGSRKECELMLKRKQVVCNGSSRLNRKTDLDPNVDIIIIDDEVLEYRERVVIALNKPAGYECSHKPQVHKSVFDLIPQKLLNRVIEPAGRLDVDTTGLLILSDDGKLMYRLTSPKKDLLKIYRVTLKHAVTEEFLKLLNEGVILNDSDVVEKAAYFEKIDDTTVDLGIVTGKYHQVKRMVAAAHNRVVKLHREQIGALKLSELNIAEGSLRYLSDEEITMIESKGL